jgi:outer membrane protein assembly factor BamE (lipoprotein component of BamABCDE complex)
MRAFVGRLGLAAMLAVGISGCADNIDPRGNAPLPEALAQIEPGRVTRSDVVALIGTPATASLFGDDHWYYISSHFQTVAFYAPEELDRQVVVIDFDKAGTVTAIRKLGLQDGKEVAMVGRQTPAPGKELSLLEQLIGNVGKFNDTAHTRADGPTGP